MTTNSILESVKERVIADTSYPFEIAVARELEFESRRCSHSGYYVDPVTGKARQYDIRAIYELTPTEKICLSVECKNIPESDPLIIRTTKRKHFEAFSDHFYFGPIRTRTGNGGYVLHHETLEETVEQPAPDNCRYVRDGRVGRGMLRLGKAGTRSETDDVWERMNQAITSSWSWAIKARKVAFEVSTGTDPLHLGFLPVLVVPPNTLYEAYNEPGKTDEVQAVKAATVYQDLEFPVGLIPEYAATQMRGNQPPQRAHNGTEKHFRISHLEIVTQDHLPAFLKSLKINDNFYPYNFFGRKI